MPILPPSWPRRFLPVVCSVLAAMFCALFAPGSALAADLDGDGVEDARDNCPALANADQANADRDRLGDACDPYPALDLRVVAVPDTDLALAGSVHRTTFRLEDAGGTLQDALAGVRVTLTLSGAARYGLDAAAGRLLAGGGTNRALVEFENGLCALDVEDDAFEITLFGADDTEGIGISLPDTVLHDFEAHDGGYTHSGVRDPWQWGVPTFGPPAAYSGTRVWATNLSGRYQANATADLVTTPFRLPIGRAPRLTLRQWVALDGGFDFVSISVSADAGPFEQIDTTTGSIPAWEERSYALARFSGRSVRVRFRLTSNATVNLAGYYLDDVTVSDLAAVIEFLDPDDDRDLDGLSNREEFARGSDPRRDDTDADNIRDRVDNCPTVWNPGQLDNTDGDGTGDACDDADGDGASDEIDNCTFTPNADQRNEDTDPFGDACDNCPSTWNPDQRNDVHPNGIGDACDDPDGDGVPDAEDVCPDSADPVNRDSDWDSRGNACDNCPLVANQDQADVVAPDGEGDACDDSDADGIVDLTDNCPFVPGADQDNRDGDRLGDACDPFPDRALVVRPVVPRYVPQGQSVRVTFRLEDAHGALAADLSGIRVRLLAHGPAVFGDTAFTGALLDGGGTAAAQIEFAGGLAVLDLVPGDGGRVVLGVRDEAGSGVDAWSVWRTDLETDDGGLKHFAPVGRSDPWAWGVPAKPYGRPATGFSGAKAWTTRLGEQFRPLDAGLLVSPFFDTGTDAEHVLRFMAWAELWYASAFLEYSVDRGTTWMEYPFLSWASWAEQRFELPRLSEGSIVFRLRFASNDANYTASGWIVDDFELKGLATVVEFFDPEGDFDADGVSNGDEHAAGTDLRAADSDLDLFPDASDNCPAVPNPDQADVVHRGGPGRAWGDACDDPDGDGVADLLDACPSLADDQRNRDDDGIGDACDNCPGVTNRDQSDAIHPGGAGDACDDPDGDGVPDLSDLCPDAADPANGDADGDGIGNACDLHPDVGLVVRAVVPALALTSSPARVTFRLEDRDGTLRSDLAGVRYALQLGGSATFGTHAIEGLVVEGAGTSRVLVELVAGRCTLDVVDVVAGDDVPIEGHDDAGLGIDLLGDVRFDFERGDGGFRAEIVEGTDPVWRRGEPRLGPRAAASGTKVWGTALDERPAPSAKAALVSPPFELPAASRPQLTAAGWLGDVEMWTADGTVEVRAENTTTWEPVGHFSSPRTWERRTFELARWAGTTIRVRFVGQSPWSAEGMGFFVDDVALTGLSPRLRFVDPADDDDGDGLSNETEIAQGTAPGLEDTDADGVGDAHDNCPAAGNADQRDRDGDGTGDACDDGDGDGLDDARDLCPAVADVFQRDIDRDGLGDACDPYPAAALRARVVAGGVVLAGAPLPVHVVLEDQDGLPRSDLAGIRVALAVAGQGAAFATSAREGLLVEGGGTSRVVLVFVDARAAIDLVGADVASLELSASDPDGIGLSGVAEQWRADFDANDAGFVASEESWTWRTETLGGFNRVWGSSTGRGAPLAGTLATPPVPLAGGAALRLEYRSRLDEQPLGGEAAVYTQAGTAVGRALDTIDGPQGGWRTRRVDVTGLSGVVRFLFKFRPEPGRNPAGWTIDDVALVGDARTIVVLDPASDDDGDGLTNGGEIEHGTPPLSADLDGDGRLDPDDNCPLVPNADQRDAVVPVGPGDACGDADGDGLDDARDRCPHTSSTDNADMDADGLGDACDPFPALVLFAMPDAPRFALADAPRDVTFTLVDATGRVRDDLAGVRTTLTLDGAAVFTETGAAREGVTFVAGRVTRAISGAGEVVFGNEDTSGQGVRVPRDVVFDFEHDASGVTHAPLTPYDVRIVDPWSWGVPLSGPGAGYESAYAFTTDTAGPLEGAYAAAYLPPFVLPPGRPARLAFRSWLESSSSCASGRLTTRWERDRSWALQRTIDRGSAAWTLHEIPLGYRAGRPVEVRFEYRGPCSGAFGSWTLDDVAWRGLSIVTTFLPGSDDSDGDGATNAAEIATGTDPLAQDTDADGLPDSADNCAAIANADQRDDVHPGGTAGASGDACDDPDGDGLADAADRCPDAADPQDPDTDADGVGDACDPLPALALRAHAARPRYAVAGSPARLALVLRDPRGALAPGLPPLQAVLALDGSAVFGTTASEGRILEGGGTNRASVEFVDGRLTLDVHDAAQEEVRLTLIDVAGRGIELAQDTFTSFEDDDAGFRHLASYSTYSDPWARGVPTGGPGRAASGTRVFATALDGRYPERSDAMLVSPEFTVPDTPGASLSFASWFRAADGSEVASIDVLDGYSWRRTLGLSADEGSWRRHTIDLSPWRGKRTMVRFTFYGANGGDASGGSGWFVDDVRIAGPPVAITFVAAEGDGDGDGLSNGDDVARGGSPYAADTDGDGIGDALDNCIARANPDQRDDVHPGGATGTSGDACEDGDGDGVVDGEDLCADRAATETADRDGDRIGDGCDPYPDLALEVRPDATPLSVAGQPRRIGWRLQDTLGHLRPDLAGIRVTLTLSGAARFGTTAHEGRLLGGGGTNRALVEFVNGRVALDVVDDTVEIVRLGARDTARIGIAFSADWFESFETGDGELTQDGWRAAWMWGTASGAPDAFSGTKLWGTGLAGPMPPGSETALDLPPFELPETLEARLSLRYFLANAHPGGQDLEGHVVISTDGGRSWSSFTSLYEYGAPSWHEALPRFSSRSTPARLRIVARCKDTSAAPGLFIDHVRVSGVLGELRFFDAAADVDADGVPDGEEIARGSDPRRKDSDGDGISDATDNCATAWNGGQFDVVHPGGAPGSGGDACDDPDGDGVPDALDLCPDTADASNADRDGDRRGDACDARPDLALRVRAVVPGTGLAGAPLAARFRLEDARGTLRADLSGLRVVLTASGSAVFGATATEGLLLEGGGTNRVLVEFVAGLVELPLEDTVVEPVALTALDVDGADLDTAGVLRFDFEDGPRPFAPGVEKSLWSWGAAVAGPGTAYSGVRALRAEGYDGLRSIVSGPIPIEEATELSLRTWVLLGSSEGALVEVSADGGATWAAVDRFAGYPRGWEERRVPLAPNAGRTARLRLRVADRVYWLSPQSWFVDDVELRGGPTRVTFLDGGADLDGDGLSNATERALGSDWTTDDTDGDGVPDGKDNCPLLANPNQRDDVRPDGTGDACDDPDGDGFADADDVCPDLAGPQDDADADRRGDACDVCPQVYDPAQADRDRDGTGDACTVDPGRAIPPQAPWTLPFVPIDAVFEPARPRLWAADAEGRRVVLVDLETGQPVREYRFEFRPVALALTPNANRLVVACATREANFSTYQWSPGRGLFATIDLSRAERVAQVSVDHDPHDLIVTRQDKVVSSAGVGYIGGSLSAFELSTGRRIVAYLDASAGARLAIDAEGTRFYATTVDAYWYWAFTVIYRYVVEPGARYEMSWNGGVGDEVLTSLDNQGSDRIWVDPAGTTLIQSNGRTRWSRADRNLDLRAPWMLDTPAPLHDVAWDGRAGDFWVAGRDALTLHAQGTLERRAAWPLGGAPLFVGRWRGTTYAVVADGTGTRIERVDYDHPPHAAAGPDAAVECTGDGRADVVLDGRTSDDPDSTPGTTDDIVEWRWTRGGELLAATPTASVPLALGTHDIALSVRDAAGVAAEDGVTVTVADTAPPAGAVTFPAAGACFGPAALPVVVRDDVSDVCDAAPSRAYDPPGGPAYDAHGDTNVTLTVTDASGLMGLATVGFTIDRVAPVVALSPGRSLSWTAHDDDGAAGGVVLERLWLDECVVYDGATWGDRDGLLSDENLTFEGALCRARDVCGQDTWNSPRLRIEAQDCGGNSGSASRVLPGRQKPICRTKPERLAAPAARRGTAARM